MTEVHSIVINTLLSGGYMVKMKTHSQREVYRVYNMRGMIAGQFGYRGVDALERYLPHRIFKRDKNGKITIMRRKVQQLHGRCTVKRIYKEFLKARA